MKKISILAVFCAALFVANFAQAQEKFQVECKAKISYKDTNSFSTQTEDNLETSKTETKQDACKRACKRLGIGYGCKEDCIAKAKVQHITCRKVSDPIFEEGEKFPKSKLRKDKTSEI